MKESCLTCLDYSSSSDEVKGLIASFKETYGESAFLCRYRFCPRSTSGFGSTNEREKHEQTHMKPYKCSDPTCEFYISGFSTSTARQKHNRKYHTSPGDSEVPHLRPRLSGASPDASSKKTARLSLLPANHEPDELTATNFRAFHPRLSDWAGPFLILPEQVMDLPHLTLHEKSELSKEVRRHWNVLDVALADENRFKAAGEKLVKISQSIKDAVRAFHRQLGSVQDGMLVKLDVDTLPADEKKLGKDWNAVFNPKELRVLDIDALWTFPNESPVCALAISPLGNYVSIGSNKLIQIFDITSGKSVYRFQLMQLDGECYIRGMSFHPDGRSLITGDEAAVVRIFGLKHQILKDGTTVQAGAWTLQSNGIQPLADERISHSNDGPIRDLLGHEMDIYDIDCSNDGQLIASCSGDKTVRLWGFESSECMAVLGHKDALHSVSFSPDAKYVVAGSLCHKIVVWDCETGHLINSLKGHNDSIYGLGLSPCGDRFATCSLDKTILMWSSDDGYSQAKPTMTLEGHTDYVLCVAFSPDGKWIASGGKDKALQFWDAETGLAQLNLQGHKNSGKTPAVLLVPLTMRLLTQYSSNQSCLQSG